MNYYGNSVNNLIQHFARLPGIGGKSAQRLAFHVINMPEDEAKAFAQSILNAKQEVRFCAKCCNLTDNELCDICSNPSRDSSTVMVVESPRDMAAYEKTGEYKGLYHILHGAMSPMRDIGPEDIKIKELLARINDDIQEVILATNPTVEGEATAVYISRLLKPMGIVVSRIAHGVPMGSDIEFVDQITLSRALEGRRQI